MTLKENIIERIRERLQESADPLDHYIHANGKVIWGTGKTEKDSNHDAEDSINAGGMNFKDTDKHMSKLKVYKTNKKTHDHLSNHGFHAEARHSRKYHYADDHIVLKK